MPFWVRAGLSPLWLASQGYRVAAGAHRVGYASGVRRRRRLPCPVVSIGNLTLGGTGKTPLTEWTAQWYQRQGWRVAVLSRGYGGTSTEQPQVVSAGDGPVTDWRTAGDEAFLLARRLPGVPVLVGRNRYASGLYAYERFGAQVLVLDDGFQHHALHRDCDIVLIDASNPFGHGALLPRGTLREPLHALRRARVIVLSRIETAGDEVPGLCEQIRRYAGRQPIYRMAVSPHGLYRHGTGCSVDPSWLQQRRVVAFAGLGNPRAFAASFAHGAGRMWRRFWPSRIIIPTPRQTGRPFARLACREGAEALVTTEKDAVRLDASWPLPVPLYSLRINVSILPRTIRR